MRRVVTVVSKEGCHLCEALLEALSGLVPRYDIEVRVLDIAQDSALHDRYWLTVPVVQIDGRDVFDAGDMRPGADYSSRLESLLKL